uniref:Uncharacterized protein n=1 Tax=Opuntia streptacantha TaxID=393608 RepID=A0A7C9A4U7_OPUST
MQLCPTTTTAWRISQLCQIQSFRSSGPPVGCPVPTIIKHDATMPNYRRPKRNWGPKRTQDRLIKKLHQRGFKNPNHLQLSKAKRCKREIKGLCQKKTFNKP